MKRALGALVAWTIVVWVILSPTLATAKTPSAHHVLARYVVALGGKKNLQRIHTMVFRGSMEFPDLHASGTAAEYFEAPNHFAVFTEVPGRGTTKFVYDGEEAWQVDNHNKLTRISGAALADIKRRSDIHWNLRLREFYPNIEVKGREPVDGKDAWKLEATVEAATYDFFFDVRTGLLTRFDTDQHVPNGTSSVSISDYRRLGKVLFAFGAAQTEGPVKWKRALTEVKFNAPIDDSIFAKPAPPTSTTP